MHPSDISGAAIGVNLAASAVAIVVLMALTYLYSRRTEVYSFIDTVWGLGFAVVEILSFVLSSAYGVLWFRLLVLGLTAVWGVRLAVHIHLRNRGKGEDPRYAEMLERNTGPVGPFLLRKVYGPQGAVMWVVSLPVQVAMYEPRPLAVLTVAGVVVWAVGFVFETVGDWQLTRFKADPANRGKIMDRGLWAWTRHPNYFGDASVWWGLFLLACSHWAGLLTVVGPVLMTYMLVNLSGKVLLERAMARKRGKEFTDYVARTSGFIPLPPRRRTT